MSTTPCTPAPPPPPNGSSDWTARVQGNCFTNIQRLGLWTGGTTQVPTGDDPSSYFQAVNPGSIGGGSNPPSIYVVTHGWAPGYRQAVTNAGGKLRWWDSNASVSGIWASDWAWSPVSGIIVPLSVNATGTLQSITTFDPKAVALAYSWIDDSATDSGDLNLDEVYGSEAYTHVNGIRLASALLQAIAPSFWSSNGTLRILGHSHGSKVATVAAYTLQQHGYRVAHLTILDSPESESTLEANAANLLGFYLEKMQITDPSTGYGGGAFIDNYASYFGVSYTGSTNLQNVVEVALDASHLYHVDDPGDRHTYAAPWYGGAAAGASSQKEPPLGFAWPPPPSIYTPALNQNWPTGVNQFSQWNLQAGSSIHDVYSYSTKPLSVAKVSTQGNVNVTPSAITFGPASGTWPAYSTFHGSYRNPTHGDGYGISFDLVWTGPQVGDYFVVTMESPFTFQQEVLLVMDGQSLPAGRTSIAINSRVSDLIFSLAIYMFFVAASGNTYGQISVSNFGLVEVGSSSGFLEARRALAAEERKVKRALKAPMLSPKVS